MLGAMMMLVPSVTCWSAAPAVRPAFNIQHTASISPSMGVPTSELIAGVSAAGAIPSALAAYGHYLSVITSVACLTVERLTIKPAMSVEEEKVLSAADAIYGLAAVGLAFTGYLRVTEYGKGWEFYQHEPIFWVKLTLLAVAGAASFFPTTIIIQRSLKQRSLGDTPIKPMSEELATRMTSIMNAELLAFLSIPLAATLMARGVGYAEWLPWQVGAAPAVLSLGGLGYKYIKEALEFSKKEGA